MIMNDNTNKLHDDKNTEKDDGNDIHESNKRRNTNINDNDKNNDKDYVTKTIKIMMIVTILVMIC